LVERASSSAPVHSSGGGCCGVLLFFERGMLRCDCCSIRELLRRANSCTVSISYFL
jgi:hypothetical protein